MIRSSSPVRASSQQQQQGQQEILEPASSRSTSLPPSQSALELDTAHQPASHVHHAAMDRPASPRTPPSAVDDEDDSELSEAPTTIEQKMTRPDFLPSVATIAEATVQEDWIRPYIADSFDVYSQITGEEEHDVSPTRADLAKKITFPSVTSATVFADYLDDAENLSVQELHHRTERVARCLVDLQREIQAQTRIIEAHDVETRDLKQQVEEDQAQRRRELVKQWKRDDEMRQRLAPLYHDQLQKQGPAFYHWLRTDVQDYRARQHLRDLHDPVYMQQVEAERPGMETEFKKLQKKDYIARLNQSLHVYSDEKTKAELESERKMHMGPVFLDPVVFDDQVTADAYGFERSKHPSHYGRQPLPNVHDKTGRSRGRLAKLGKRVHDRTRSPDDDYEGRQKRQRRAPRFPDEELARLSRSSTPALSINGAQAKRRGRPPKSKLRDVEVAPPSTPTKLESTRKQSFDDASQEDEDGVSRYTSPGRVAEPIPLPIEPPAMANATPKKRRNRTKATAASKTMLKASAPAPPAPVSPKAAPATILPPITFISVNNQPRKIASKTTKAPVLPDERPIHEPAPSTVPQFNLKWHTHNSDSSTTSGKLQKQPSHDSDGAMLEQRGEEDDESEAHRKALVRAEKSRKLSENMKKRWASGSMKVAQETRKVNNALKKAAKESGPIAAPPPPTSMPVYATILPPPEALATLKSVASTTRPVQAESEAIGAPVSKSKRKRSVKKDDDEVGAEDMDEDARVNGEVKIAPKKRRIAKVTEEKALPGSKNRSPSVNGIDIQEGRRMLPQAKRSGSVSSTKSRGSSLSYHGATADQPMADMKASDALKLATKAVKDASKPKVQKARVSKPKSSGPDAIEVHAAAGPAKTSKRQTSVSSSTSRAADEAGSTAPHGPHIVKLKLTSALLAKAALDDGRSTSSESTAKRKRAPKLTKSTERAHEEKDGDEVDAERHIQQDIEQQVQEEILHADHDAVVVGNKKPKAKPTSSASSKVKTDITLASKAATASKKARKAKTGVENGLGTSTSTTPTSPSTTGKASGSVSAIGPPHDKSASTSSTRERTPPTAVTRRGRAVYRRKIFGSDGAMDSPSEDEDDFADGGDGDDDGDDSESMDDEATSSRPRRGTRKQQQQQQVTPARRSAREAKPYMTMEQLLGPGSPSEEDDWDEDVDAMDVVGEDDAPNGSGDVLGHWSRSDMHHNEEREPEPEAEPEPEQVQELEPEQQPQPEPEPAPAPQPASAPESEPEPQPAPQPAPAPPPPPPPIISYAAYRDVSPLQVDEDDPYGVDAYGRPRWWRQTIQEDGWDGDWK